MLESRVGVVALGGEPVLHVEVPADRLVVLIGRPSAFQGLVSKGSKQRLLGFAGHCPIAKPQSIHIGGCALREALFGAPDCNLLRRRIAGRWFRRLQVAGGEPGGELLVGLCKGHRVFESIEGFTECLVAASQVLTPGFRKGFGNRLGRRWSVSQRWRRALGLRVGRNRRIALPANRSAV